MSEGDPISFRPLVETDITMLFEWLQRSHVAAWWHQEDSIEAVREKYLPRIAGKDAAHPYLALMAGEPIGYIQVYRAADGDLTWWPDRPGPGVYGIDQFLADGNRLDQGLGTAMVTRFAAKIFEDPAVEEIRVDPRPDNARAIRCYRKVGFQAVGEIVTPDGPALWMVLKRPGANTT